MPPSTSPRSPSSPPARSPPLSPAALREALSRRHRNAVSSRSLLWAGANLAAACVSASEARWGTLRAAALGDDGRFALTGVVAALTVIFLVNVAMDLWARLRPLLFVGDDPVVLSSRQMRLLRVGQADPGFKLAPETSTPVVAHPNPFGPPLEGSFVLPPDSPAAAAYSPSNTTYFSSNNASLDSSSWVFQQQRATPAALQPQSPNQKRAVFNSSVGPISDENSLREYLEEFNSWERRRSHNASLAENQMQQSPDSTGRSFWRPLSQVGGAQGVQDYSPVLNRLAYQVSTPMPGSSTAGEENAEKGSGRISQGHHGRKEDICYMIGIEHDELVDWMSNLRMWISQTILKRLAAEIDETNAQLAKLGLSELVLGQTGLEKAVKTSRLPHVATAVPDLHRLVAFLELCPNQEYLVGRVRELSRGGAMGDFRWNGGGRYKGAEWAPDRGLPTDPEVVMHSICAYFDSRLPPLEGVVDGRVFSTLHFLKETDKKDKSSTAMTAAKTVSPPSATVGSWSLASSSIATASLAIVQTGAHPLPHYALRFGEGNNTHRLEVSPGRNNLFHTLLLFLHHVKTKEHGILARVNLGRSGLNVLWVID